MQVYDCCTLVRQRYAEIGSGEQGYIPKAIHCAIKTLNSIASDDSLPEETRDQAANLLISDHEDA
ncbi:hypothetical protein A1OW_10270 [Enterovibrio norvegicus]|uniref:YaeP family protein n=1 Tax=Enterovibrio norvegicus TaxID=188144 RepID=UPI00031A431D|nr:YaeP family protein [Enterovibrio norvegicus]OEF51286.1 hypothetical protein A1OW_10270 [Enterovibrio norvegicus]